MDRKKAQAWGSDLIRTRISREPYFLEKRSWKDLKFWEWIFIIFALLSIAISIGFSVFHLVVTLIDGDNKFVFPVLVILNNLFSAYFLWNGVMEELPFKILIQLVIKCIVWVFDLIFFLMPALEAGENDDDETKMEIRQIRFYISSAMLFMTVVTGAFVVYQYWTSNISIFRQVGTEPKYVRLCRTWNFCQSMILFDAVMFLTVVFQLFSFPKFITSEYSYLAFYLLPICLVVTCIYVVLGIKAIEKESRMLTYLLYVASHFQPIFIIFLLVKASRAELGLLLLISLYVTSILSIFTHIGLLVSVVRLQNAYGMGLRQAAARETERKHLVETANAHLQNDKELQIMGDRRQPPPTETEL